MFSHNVFFTLHDSSPAAVDKLVTECQTYLGDHPGTVFFAAGRIAEEMQRPVNDRDFQVALVLVFADQQSHDLYQAAPRHDEFIQRNKESWKAVRVFDSRVAGSAS